LPNITARGGEYNRRVHPVAALVGKGATPKQAAVVIWGSGMLVAVTTGLWFVDRPTAVAVLIVTAISGPRALLCLVARWGRPGAGAISAEIAAWPALHRPS
jgi:hypothetical protein